MTVEEVLKLRAAWYQAPDDTQEEIDACLAYERARWDLTPDQNAEFLIAMGKQDNEMFG